MGEIADMMLEGDLCAGCGVYMDGDGDGFPRYCSNDCDPDCADGRQKKSYFKKLHKELKQSQK